MLLNVYLLVVGYFDRLDCWKIGGEVKELVILFEWVLILVNKNSLRYCG